MLQLPPFPTWDSLHPLIIHFPIALLLLAPLFILISAVLAPSKGKPYMIAALLLVALGTGTLFIAGSTGHAASELAERGESVNIVLEMHEDLAAGSQVVFGVLAVILLGLFLVPRLLHRQEDRLYSTFLPVAFLAMYFAGILFLINTAHAGGRLVHEFGVHAIVPATSEQSLPMHGAERSEAR
jgi:uncharacterized membrane protein